MRTIPSNMLLCLICMMIGNGCSVKENRDFCPCRLVLDCSEVDTLVVESADFVVAADDGFVFTDELAADEFCRDIVVQVPRTDVSVGVWSGTGGMLNGNGLEIPCGGDCPPVYFHASNVYAGHETVREMITMRKNHCLMTVSLNNMDSAPEEINVSGNVNGYLPDGKPSPGEFSYRLRPDGHGASTVILPRQTDNSLMMEINDGTGVLKHFAIGEFIAETGYDWNSPDLEDLSVDIDIAFTGITLIIQGWDRTYRFDVVI